MTAMDKVTSTTLLESCLVRLVRLIVSQGNVSRFSVS